MQDVPSPNVVELDAALEAMGPGTPQLREDATASDMVAVFKITIALLALVSPSTEPQLCSTMQGSMAYLSPYQEVYLRGNSVQPSTTARTPLPRRKCTSSTKSSQTRSKRTKF